ncbi:DUF4440 domain-containing protein [Dactylosporangium roseum]|uniref:DUF4440 domain-containing protein n=2 Tax=Dactylosporangium roseum TaxID=47989 RepID=A0ABY5YZW2_9ACTN|nr:DUF4440 domain-containing protein [Dactylosporangium roseum]
MPCLTAGVRDQIAIPAAAYRLVTRGGFSLTDRMTSDFNIHTDSVNLTNDASQHPWTFARAFNTGDAAVVEQVYEPGGVFVAAPGQPVAGAARAAANQRFLDLGLPIDVRPRHVYVADDIALLIVDWTIDGQGADGQHVHLQGTATDVARRGPDGCWRYVIDNPFGTARL